MEYKIGDLICSTRYQPAGFFDLGVVTNLEGSEIKDGWVWIYVYVIDWGETERYNLRTDKHIKKDQKMDKLIYERYMTHQPYEDCDGLELDAALSWEPGALLVWDRIRIHSSDNFLINGIDNKTCIALFTSK